MTRNRPAGARVPILALGAIILLVYCNSFNAGLPFDNVILRQDPRLQVLSFENVRDILVRNYWWPIPSSEYRPLTSLTYLLNRAAAGDSPAAFHAVNVALHWLNAALVYLLALALWKRRGPAFLTAALFAVHPLGTEAVTNVVGRADLLATAAVLGALLLYIRRSEAGGRRLAAVAALGTAGMFAKESAVVLPALVLLYDALCRKRTPGKRVSPSFVVLLLPLALFGAVRWAVFRALPPAWFPLLDNPLAHADFWTARMTAVKVLGKSVWLYLWPAQLSPDYSYDQIPLVDWRFRRWEDWQALFAMAVLVTALGLLVRLRRRNPAITFLGLAVFAALVPTANLLIPIGCVLGERFLYLPSAGLAGCVVAGVYALPGSTRIRVGPHGAAALLAILGACWGVRTYVRNFDWQDDAHLWEAARTAAPHSFKVHKNLAQAWAASPDAARRIDEIIAEAELGVEIMKPLPPADRDRYALMALGGYYRLKGDLEAVRNAAAGAPWYRKSLDALLEAEGVDSAIAEVARSRASAQIGRDYRVLSELGLTYLRLGRFPEAVTALEQARGQDPEQMLPYYLLFYAYEGSGRPADAVVCLHEALVLGGGRDRNVLAAAGEFYRRSGQTACALAPGAAGLNASCPAVRQNLCGAYEAIARTLIAAGAQTRTAAYRATAARTYGCPLP